MNKYYWQKKLNTARWISLSTVFLLLLIIPFFYLYQTYVASNVYDHLSLHEQAIFVTIKTITSPFIANSDSLSALKGNTWSGMFFGLKISDPLALVSLSSKTQSLYTPILIAALIPIFLTLIFGRFFCGWICPGTFIYELADSLALLIRRNTHFNFNLKLNKNIKYLILALGIGCGLIFGISFFSLIYPPAIIGRELYYLVALGGFSSGILIFLLTLALDLFVIRRGFCRYLCPGGALYSLLGKFRIVRIQRDVTQCNDCEKCDAACQFHLSPLRDSFGAECNNCTACIQICPTNALSLTIKLADNAYQGAGHLGKNKSDKVNEKKQSIANPETLNPEKLNQLKEKKSNASNKPTQQRSKAIESSHTK